MVRIVLVAAVAVCGFAGEPGLMPWPAKMAAGSGGMNIDAGFSVRSSYSDARLKAAMERLTTRVGRQAGIEITGGGRGLTIDCQERGDIRFSLLSFVWRWFFPARYKLPPTRREAINLLGNAIPPPMARDVIGAVSAKL